MSIQKLFNGSLTDIAFDAHAVIRQVNLLLRDNDAVADCTAHAVGLIVGLGRGVIARGRCFGLVLA